MKFLIYNFTAKKVAYKLWHSKMLNDNLIYKKIINKQINKKINQYRKTPFCLRIENTNICNAKCYMCPREMMKRSQGTMSDELFNTIIEQAHKMGIDYINLHNYGEPLIDNKLAQRVKKTKTLGIAKVTTNSNGQLLTPETSKTLLEAGLDELFISLDAINEDTYKIVRVGLNYQQVISNLETFLKLRDEQKAKTKLIVSFVQSDKNHTEAKKFIQYWKNRADHVSVSFAHDWIGSKQQAASSIRLPYACRLLFSDLTISWNGNYILCCADFDEAVKLGNIKDQSLIKYWTTNQILASYRQKHLNQDTTKLIACNNCTLNTAWWF